MRINYEEKKSVTVPRFKSTIQMARVRKIFSNTNFKLAKIMSLFQTREFRNCEISNEGKKCFSSDSKEKFDETRECIAREIITSNTEITRDHLTPELRLRLLTPNCRLYNEPIIIDETLNDSLSMKNHERQIFHEPFWCIYWPGGQALTRFILDHGSELLNESKKGTNFLDIGSGCGASAIAAKMIGASRVVANDIDKVACIAAKLNASLNGVDIEVTSKNLLENRVREYETSLDVILVGDLLYDDEIAESLIPWLEEAVRENGSRIYVGDPGRHALTGALKSRMKLREKYSLPVNVRRENYGYNDANVWQFNAE